MPSRSAKTGRTPAARSAKAAAKLKEREQAGKVDQSKPQRDRTKATGRLPKRKAAEPKAARTKKSASHRRKPLAKRPVLGPPPLNSGNPTEGRR